LRLSKQSLQVARHNRGSDRSLPSRKSRRAHSRGATCGPGDWNSGGSVDPTTSKVVALDAVLRSQCPGPQDLRWCLVSRCLASDWPDVKWRTRVLAITRG
jgi:hypothetical protein